MRAGREGHASPGWLPPRPRGAGPRYLGAFLLLTGLQAAAGGARFHVIDMVDPIEISEDTVLFVDGHQVARFRLDAAHPEGQAEIEISGAGPHEYALCGRITLRKLDGSSEQRVVDGGGTLIDPDGRVYQALAAGDFHIFYLAPSDAVRAGIPEGTHHSGACDLPVAAAGVPRGFS